MGRARTLVAACALSALARAAEAGGGSPAAKAPPAIVKALQGVLRGPAVLPGSGVQFDDAGRLRTRELDDLTLVHVRLSIPF